MKELKLIEEIRRRAGGPKKGIKAGIGDDCAVLDYDSRHYLLWGTDMLVEGTHFRVKEVSYRKIGWKAVAVNISDIAAMGGVPEYIVVTVGIPGGMAPAAVRSIYDGVFSICREYGIEVVGGDTNRSDRLVIDVSIMGIVEKERLIRRCGAREGELVLVTGPVRNGKKEHMDFVPRLKEARFVSRYYKPSSMIDISDGMALDMRRICTESGVGCRLYAGAIPLSEGLTLEDALYFGESFELLFTMGIGKVRKLFREIKSYGRKPVYFVIGEITQRDEGLCLIEEKGRVQTLKMEGFRHL